MIKIIVAMDKNNLIGTQNGTMGMPWYCPEDLTHFKETTLQQTLLMGRKTYESIGKPLPDRKTIVVSKLGYISKDVEVVHDLDEILRSYQDSKEDLYICGGSSIYKQTMDKADELIVSYIPGEYSGHAYFPNIDLNKFECQEIIHKNSFVIKKYRRI